MERSTIMDRIEMYASNGRTSICLKLWKGQIERLRKEGFEVEVLNSTETNGLWRCEVSWRIPRNRTASYMLALSVEALAQRLKASME